MDIPVKFVIDTKDNEMFCYEFCSVQLVNYVYRNSCFATEFRLITTDSSSMIENACHANSGGFFVKMLVKKLLNIDMQKRIEYFRS